MTEKEAKVNEVLEKAHFVYDQIELRKGIQVIIDLLQMPFNMQLARTKINEFNMIYPENVTIFDFIFRPQGSCVPLHEVSDPDLIYDLRWKLAFLNAIRVGKTCDELIKAVRVIET